MMLPPLRSALGPALLRMALVSAALGLVACHQTDADVEPPAPAKPAPPPVAVTTAFLDDPFVPDQQCRVCHRDVYDAFDSIGMAHSMAPVDAATPIEDFSLARYEHADSNRIYELEPRDDALVFRRFQEDADGVYNLIERPVHAVIGSGAHARAYLMRNAMGELTLLPIAWYADPPGFRMHPGFGRPDHPGLTRRVPHDCLTCHAAVPHLPVGHARLGHAAVMPKEIAPGIGCQRCHGPGANHVAVARDPEASNEDILASVVNPANLDPARANDVCLHCHLQPDSAMQSIVRHPNLGAYDFRPGDDLADHVWHLDFGSPGDRMGRFQSNHHGHRLRLSACFADGATMGCTSCHDPHRRLTEEERFIRQRDACLTCHSVPDCTNPDPIPGPGEPVADDCVRCHMHERRAQDAVGVVTTDHRIIRPSEAGSLEKRIAPRVEMTETWAEPVVAAGAHDFGEEPDPLAVALAAMGFVTDGRARLYRALEDQPADGPEPYYRRGEAELLGGRYDAAWRTGAEIEARFGPTAATALLQARSLERLGDMLRARAAFLRGLERANWPEFHLGLATTSAADGDIEAALRSLDVAIGLRDTDLDCLLTRANLLLMTKRWDDAISAFEAVLAVSPRAAQAAYHLGLVHMERNEPDAAVLAWRRGAANAPNDVRLAEADAYGCLLDGRPRDALDRVAVIEENQAADRATCLFIRLAAHDALGQRAMAANARRKALLLTESGLPRHLLRELLQRRHAP